VLAHVAGRQRDEVKFAPGEKVTLVMSFYDLSQGRIKLETN
jgi:translation initiation factor IF-1